MKILKSSIFWLGMFLLSILLTAKYGLYKAFAIMSGLLLFIIMFFLVYVIRKLMVRVGESRQEKAEKLRRMEQEKKESKAFDTWWENATPEEREQRSLRTKARIKELDEEEEHRLIREARLRQLERMSKPTVVSSNVLAEECISCGSLSMQSLVYDDGTIVVKCLKCGNTEM